MGLSINRDGREADDTCGGAAIVVPVDAEFGAGRSGGRAAGPGFAGLVRAARLALRRPAVQAAVLTLAFVAFRLAVFGVIGLGVDESYSITIARPWSLSYFDHPPLHQWIVAASEPMLGAGRATRLPFVLLSGCASWLMFRLGRRLFGETAGVWACLVLNLAGFFTFVSGVWVLPDGPLNVCLLAAALSASRIAVMGKSRSGGAAWRDWLWTGFWIGLAGLSKYQAALFALGFGLFMLTAADRRRWLVRPQPWVAAGLALLVLTPVWVWNARHGWASFLFQGARGAPKHGLSPWGPLVSLAGQAAVLLPWVFVPLASAAWSAIRRGPRRVESWFCLMLAAPAIVVFTLTPLWGDRALPHWAMPGWLMIVPLAGDYLARPSRRSWAAVWLKVSLAATGALWILATVEVSTGLVGRIVGRSGADPTLESVEWRNLRGPVEAALKATPHCPFVAAARWNDGGKVGQAVGDLAPVRVLGSDPRGFAYRQAPSADAGCDAILVVPAGRSADRLAELRSRFGRIEPAGVDIEGRGGPEITLDLYRGYGFRPE